MAVPKRRHSKARRDKKRTHKKLDIPSFAKCGHCGRAKKPHAICPYCGHYKGKKVLEIKVKKKDKTQK
ncbi:MAG: 50S ribosomal protein L32 [Candidatus Omnitrophica bacterium]|nr:50S ribosomal protein L32 [Candidatus Omnitrophota bacterium]